MATLEVTLSHFRKPRDWSQFSNVTSFTPLKFDNIVPKITDPKWKEMDFPNYDFWVSLLNFGRVGMATNNWFKNRAIVVCCILYAKIHHKLGCIMHSHAFRDKFLNFGPKSRALAQLSLWCHFAQLDMCQALPFLRHARVPGRQLLWIIWAFRPLQTLKIATSKCKHKATKTSFVHWNNLPQPSDILYDDSQIRLTTVWMYNTL